MKNFEFYNNIHSAVLVIGKNKKIIFKNTCFSSIFGDINNTEKIKKRFNFDACALISENINEFNPLDCAIESIQNFFSVISYQSKNGEFLFFKLNSFSQFDNKVLVFDDISSEIQNQSLTDNLKKAKAQCNLLIEENKKCIEIKQMAQAQAVKMALLNRVSNSIRESIDFQNTITSALKELFSLFGAFKIYYAKFEPNKDVKSENFLIESVYPSKFDDLKGKTISFDEENLKKIKNREFLLSTVFKEYENASESYKKAANRAIIPIYHLSDLIGIIVILSNQKIIDETQKDLIGALNAQLAGAIVQSYLFAQLNVKNDELQNTLDELKITQLQLIHSEKMASLGQLIAGVAHEINTPLASINSNNSIFSKMIQKLLNADNAGLLNTFKEMNTLDAEAIKRINNIVKSLKRFVRLDEAQLQSADINNELDLTLELIRHETKNIEIVRNYSKLPRLNCYANMLNQVFMNVLVNAIHSFKDVKHGAKITVSTGKKDENIVISIQDNGCGIDENLKDKIFSAGFTTKKVGIGTGLGLAISNKIVEKHGGKINFTSQKGVGTTFTISIPLVIPNATIGTV